MCSDLRQLPPVRANEVYKRCRDVGVLFGSTIKWHYLDYFPLIQVVRQSDASFSALLTKIGDGRALEDQEVRLLESRFITAEEALVRASTAMRIFYSNEEHMVYEARRSGHVIDASWVPIERRVTTLTLDRKTGVACRRRQFPLVQASAITVHKSQGGTYSSIVYEDRRSERRPPPAKGRRRKKASAISNGADARMYTLGHYTVAVS
ncbi:hypothetical protein HPB49_005909 [Dermacentor silvarum]|uniref:Uncharacterized protein n=1 Tax=Dermacentor silvarum TaxID=543639 RepID=A0ACB8DAZ5_DERSI|nr:hypothetical protein HPB49_005909 [Dermacentor silvarum]